MTIPNPTPKPLSGRFKIVNTDNFGGDYPDEYFLNIPESSDKTALEAIAWMLNRMPGRNEARYWQVVPAEHALQPGFEP